MAFWSPRGFHARPFLTTPRRGRPPATERAAGCTGWGRGHLRRELVRSRRSMGRGVMAQENTQLAAPPPADLDHILRKEGGRVNELWGKLFRRAPCAVLFAPLWCGANVAFNLSLALAPGPLRSVHPHRNQMPHINHHTNPRIRGAVSTSGEWPSLPDPSNRLHPHTPHRISYPHTPPPSDGWSLNRTILLEDPLEHLEICIIPPDRYIVVYHPWPKGVRQYL